MSTSVASRAAEGRNLSYVARQLTAGLLVVLQLAAGAAMPGPVAAAEATTSIAVGVASCGGEVPQCDPDQHVAVTTAGTLRAEVTTADTNCAAITVILSIDGAAVFTSDAVAPGASTGPADLGPVSPGAHTLSVEARVPLSISCDSRGWSGILSITTAGVADNDVAIVAPGGSATVSTAVTGSPRPAGITATLYRSASARGSATLSVATFSDIPSVLIPSPPPIRAAGYLDLQLTNANLGDVIAAEFYPVDPIIPNDPVLPPNPVQPSDPYLPPNPVRLAFWTGSSWDAVFGSGGTLPTYNRVANVFSLTFDASSTPAITGLTGTVFAAVPSYYFRGFGTPVDADALNVAKAGRAIPLKWQVFDFAVAPVIDLDPAVVRISSVVIPCDGGGLPSDSVEEYATGGSGLQNLGGGVYQVNWNASKSYAGTCRRLRLDLGERNPDGTPFYRTADFRFTR
jgi:hypothetical protein